MNFSTQFSLVGRRALITGSSRGIGRAIALAFSEAGADVAIHGWNDRLSAEETAQTVASLGGRACVIQSDLGSESGARFTYEQAVAGLGGSLDILVCNASVQIPARWMTVTRVDLERQVAVNYLSTFELLQFAVPAMAERKWGRVLTIGSVQECVPNPEMLVYSSLKNAQTALGFSLAKQYASHGVTINNLAPGVIETDRYHDRVKTPEHAERLLAWIPAGNIGQPADCVGAALLLCSDAGRYITGQNLFVDGGMSL